MKSGKHFHLGARTRDLFGACSGALFSSPAICILTPWNPDRWPDVHLSSTAVSKSSLRALLSKHLLVFRILAFVSSLYSFPGAPLCFRTVFCDYSPHVIVAFPLVKWPAFQCFKRTLDIFNSLSRSGFEAFIFPFFF